MTSETSAATARRRLYGRGKGRPLSQRQQALMEEVLPRLAVPAEGALTPSTLFPDAEAVSLEIGFGAGDHLAAQAQQRPEHGFLGVEFFEEGVAKALGRLVDAGSANVRLYQGDGRDVLERLPEASLAGAYLLFPDPWPKARHHKRRFLQPDTVAECARVLRPGAVLRVATDVKSYVAWTLRHVRAHGAFSWTARGPQDWRTPPADHVRTRYETKNIGDCPPVFLDFVREG